MSAPKLMTLQEAIEFLSIGEWQMREYVRQGLLPRKYQNGRLVFYQQDLVAFIKKGGTDEGKH